jgi:hypothetical protein
MLSELLKWQVIFLAIVQVQDSPHDPLRFLPEKIIPILNKNIIIAKTRIVRNIVNICISKFKSILTEVRHHICI